MREYEGSNVSQTLRNLEAANIGRNNDVYQGFMSAATFAKAHSLFPYFGEVPDHARIVDVGSGTGDVAELAAVVFRNAQVIGVDLSKKLIVPAYTNRSRVSYVRADGTMQNFASNSIHIKMYGTVGHEIESFAGKGKMHGALRASYEELEPGGLLLVRDFAKPERQEPIYMQLYEINGVDRIEDARVNGKVNYSLLSKDALFRQFHNDFHGGNAFSYRYETIDGEKYIYLSPKLAHEFYLRKDYTENYPNEIREEYVYWSIPEGVQAYNDAGYTNIMAIPDPNEYIKKNRLEGKVGLFDMNDKGKLQPIEIPPTHMLLVGRKPEVKKVFTGFTLKEYMQINTSIIYDEKNSTIAIRDKQFLIDTTYPVIKGSKKRVFHLQGTPPRMLKVVRNDTEVLNFAAIYKAMFESIAYEHILDEHHVPHTKILEIDEKKPTSFVIQEGLPQDAICAANLIKTNALSETDVAQIASIVNSFELERKWQLDTNPFNWYRITKENGTTEMTYVDGKVYEYEKSWEFKRVGLLQWINPTFVSDVSVQSAHLPKVKDYDELVNSWKKNANNVALWWKKHLANELQPK